ncbi:hypothetical protein A1F94_002674 [Pyrenophora tritici-repentis]|uniref:Uncharacterized protein n=1 Tax=Pyrenophora tritici-repentis TaxID=45151 RepID=A0A834S4F2_9PLEO|nr:hypothetical protein PtrM4_069490 [Pyrenophora tritici-repentis]KAG9385924.1 hypothetical protein A1F94_002674 [Pyrenophora tritici-repentis]KAI0588033.1 hypothetical protein Alg215_01145 [Pyrenophora tritici-repentis]KAI0614065.1 hypothetical protein TUN205_01670 [Pyrenophora tritici-repentis]
MPGLLNASGIAAVIYPAETAADLAKSNDLTTLILQAGLERYSQQILQH